MINRRHKVLTVFEHQILRVGDSVGNIRFEQKHLNALEKFHGSGVPYFSLVHMGIKFCEYVGVLQVGDLTIEILPKTDKGKGGEVSRWRELLIGMLRSVGGFEVVAPTNSRLNVKRNSLLDLYFEMFISEVEILLHRGLAKRYRRTEGNLSMLKGGLHLSKHFRHNIIHKERFYTRHTVYDREHALNLILLKAVKLIHRINNNPILTSRIGGLLLNYPELPDIRVTEQTFEKITYDRKTESYRKGISIARLLLMNYHPDVLRGSNDVLAIMFDMNLLWEKFIYRSLHRYGGFEHIEQQSRKPFWKPEFGQRVVMKPDIVINRNHENCVVLDTKWKIIEGSNPSPEDLRQMYVYGHYFNASTITLVYPGSEFIYTKGSYFDGMGNTSEQECGVAVIPVNSNVKEWQREIARFINKF